MFLRKTRAQTQNQIIMKCTAATLPANCSNTASKLQLHCQQTAATIPANCSNNPSKLQLHCQQTAATLPANCSYTASKLQQQSQQTAATLPANCSYTASKLQLHCQQTAATLPANCSYTASKLQLYNASHYSHCSLSSLSATHTSCMSLGCSGYQLLALIIEASRTHPELMETNFSKRPCFPQFLIVSRENRKGGLCRTIALLLVSILKILQ